MLFLAQNIKTIKRLNSLFYVVLEDSATRTLFMKPTLKTISKSQQRKITNNKNYKLYK